MKIILTGSTGFLGQRILSQCIKNAYIDHVYSITRKPLPFRLSSHGKVSEIIVSDFETCWTTAQLRALRDADVAACIWCLGGAISRFKDYDEATLANAVLPMIAAEAFVKDLVPGVPRQPFRFVYMSVAGAEQDQFRQLWSRSQTRKMKGAAERALLVEIADREDARAKLFEVYCLRLGKVLEGGQTVGNVLTEAVSSSVTVERVVKKSLDIVLYGLRDAQGRIKKGIVENTEILGDDWAEMNALAM